MNKLSPALQDSANALHPQVRLSRGRGGIRGTVSLIARMDQGGLGGSMRLWGQQREASEGVRTCQNQRGHALQA